MNHTHNQLIEISMILETAPIKRQRPLKRTGGGTSVHHPGNGAIFLNLDCPALSYFPTTAPLPQSAVSARQARYRLTRLFRTCFTLLGTRALTRFFMRRKRFCFSQSPSTAAHPPSRNKFNNLNLSSGSCEGAFSCSL